LVRAFGPASDRADQGSEHKQPPPGLIEVKRGKSVAQVHQTFATFAVQITLQFSMTRIT